MLGENVVLLYAFIDDVHGQGTPTAFEHLAPALKDIPARYESIVFNGSLDHPVNLLGTSPSRSRRGLEQNK